MKTKKQLSISILLVTAIVLVINVLADEWFFRLDFTQDDQYTLSKATKDILEDLEEPVHVKAYFSENLPENIKKTREDFQDLLIEYGALSDGHVVFEFINPNEDQETENEALQNGVQPVMINVREKDQMKQQKAFLGAVLEYNEQKDVIPFMQPGGAMEYALTTSIKKLSSAEKPAIGILSGHGEPSLQNLMQVNQVLSVLYDVQEFKIDSNGIPSYFKTIAIIDPKDSIPSEHLRHLDKYLASGGNLFIAMNRVKGELSQNMGMEQTTGLETWLLSKGIQVNKDFVIDASCGSVSVTQQQGIFRFQNNISFPYIPIIKTFADHPVVKGLEAVVVQFASSISYIGDTTKKWTPLAMTSEQSATQSAPVFFDIQKQWTEVDFPMKNVVIAGVLEGNISGTSHSRMVVIGDGDFPNNGEQGRQQQLQPDNVSLMANSVDWLSDDTGLIDLRTKGVTYRPLDQLEDSTKTLLKYLNAFLPILLVFLYGVFRFQVKRNQRLKRQAMRME